MLKKVAIGAVIAFTLVYVIDFAQVHVRLAGKNPASVFGTVKMQAFYAIPHKDGKAEFMFGDPVDQPCVHALFPHAGRTPCWYLSRKSASNSPTVM
jgi:hypothetical protein